MRYKERKNELGNAIQEELIEDEKQSTKESWEIRLKGGR